MVKKSSPQEKRGFIRGFSRPKRTTLYFDTTTLILSCKHRLNVIYYYQHTNMGEADLMNIERFTEKARQAISQANEIAKEHNHSQIEAEHILAALLAQEGGVVQQIIQKVGGNIAAARRTVDSEIERMPRVYGGSEPSISPRLRTVLEKAWQEMANFKDEYLSVEHLLLAMLDGSDGIAQRALKAAGLTRALVLKALGDIRGSQRVTDPNPEGKYQALEKYGRNLTDLAAQGKLDPVIGRDEEIRRVIQVLSRR